MRPATVRAPYSSACSPAADGGRWLVVPLLGCPWEDRLAMLARDFRGRLAISSRRPDHRVRRPRPDLDRGAGVVRARRPRGQKLGAPS